MTFLKGFVKLIHIRFSRTAFCDKIRSYRKNIRHIKVMYIYLCLKSDVLDLFCDTK